MSENIDEHIVEIESLALVIEDMASKPMQWDNKQKLKKPLADLIYQASNLLSGIVDD